MKKTYKVGSLFAGVGGICLGFLQAENEKAKYELAWANEIDEYASATYRENFNHLLLEGDIELILNPTQVEVKINKIEQELQHLSSSLESNNDRKLTSHIKKLENELNELKNKHAEQYYEKLREKILSVEIDVLNGGFPCQAFSIAGEQKGFDDERGNLFLSIVNLINQLGGRHKKPRVLLLENVKNLMSHDQGRTYPVIKKQLEKCGYTIYEAVLNTMHFTDLPQNRERIYIVGFLNKKDADKFQLFNCLSDYKNNKDSLERIEDVKKVIDYENTDSKYFYTKEKYPQYFMNEEDFITQSLNKKGVRINLEESIDEMYQFYQLRRGMYVRKNMSDVCPTLTANMGTGGHNVPLVKTPNGIRKLTPAEAFKLQGFPVGDGYKLPIEYKGRPYADSHLYKQAGNAVSVPVIKLIAEEILRVLED